MALTNYLGQNIVAGLIFYGHGLGLYGEFSQSQIFVMCIVIYSTQVALSSAWMARVNGGPFELLWRRLTYPRR